MSNNDVVPKVAVTIIGPTEDEALRDMDEAIKQRADILEIRRDFFYELNLERIAKQTDLPKIFTCRNVAEAGPARGAGFRGTEQERKGLYEKSVSLGFDYLDIGDEHYDAIMPKKSPIKLESSKLITSWHGFNGTPDWSELFCRFERMRDKNPYIIKMATMANSPEDNKTMLNFSAYVSENYSNQKKLLMTMGSLCEETRVCGPDYEMEWVYACLEGKPASVGQPTIRALREKWKPIGFYLKP